MHARLYTRESPILPLYPYTLNVSPAQYLERVFAAVRPRKLLYPQAG